MEQVIKYIPFADKGPHYVESGARPEIRETEFSVNVIVQDGNDVFPANYTPDDDRFATLYADTTVRPICWWHLPDPAPATEREWFVAEASKLEVYDGDNPYDTQISSFRGFGLHSTDADANTDYYFFPLRESKEAWECDPYFSSNALFRVTGPFDRHYPDALLHVLYDHWVAAGRP